MKLTLGDIYFSSETEIRYGSLFLLADTREDKDERHSFVVIASQSPSRNKNSSSNFHLHTMKEKDVKSLIQHIHESRASNQNELNLFPFRIHSPGLLSRGPSKASRSLKRKINPLVHITSVQQFNECLNIIHQKNRGLNRNTAQLFSVLTAPSLRPMLRNSNML